MITQLVGNCIPALLHTVAATIYKPLATAPVFEYTDDIPASSTTTHHPSIPNRLHFIYLALNETSAECKNGKTNRDIIRDKEPSKLYANIMDIQAHTNRRCKQPITTNTSNDEKVNTTFLGTHKCHQVILQTQPQLLPYYKKETYGRHKSDICRLAQLYLKGGYYLDNDTKVLKAFRLPDHVTFATVWGIKKQHFAQGIIFAAPVHPILQLALNMTLDYYRETHVRRPGIKYDEDSGRKILYDACHKAVADDSSLKDKSLLLEEIILKKPGNRHCMSQVEIPLKRNINYCSAAFVYPRDEQVYFLARAPGTSYCELETSSSWITF